MINDDGTEPEEAKKFSRRAFLTAAALGATAVLTGCEFSGRPTNVAEQRQVIEAANQRFEKLIKPEAENLLAQVKVFEQLGGRAVTGKGDGIWFETTIGDRKNGVSIIYNYGNDPVQPKRASEVSLSQVDSMYVTYTAPDGKTYSYRVAKDGGSNVNEGFKGEYGRWYILREARTAGQMFGGEKKSSFVPALISPSDPGYGTRVEQALKDGKDVIAGDADNPGLRTALNRVLARSV